MLNSLTFLPTYVPDKTHMQHVLGVWLEMHYPSTRSTTLILNENTQGSILPHFEYYPVLPAIAVAVPLHGANERG